MPVYRSQNRKKQPRVKPFTVILLAVLVAAAVAVLLSVFAGGQAVDAMAEESAANVDISGEGPLAALEAIYEGSEIRGVSSINAVVLDEQFGITSDLYLKAWGRYTDGTYGIADVFIFRLLEGHEDALREALEQVKTNRILECRNYDIYNSLECAEEGQIFQVGEDYLCLVMIEDADNAREILEDSLLKN